MLNRASLFLITLIIISFSFVSCDIIFPKKTATPVDKNSPVTSSGVNVEATSVNTANQDAPLAKDMLARVGDWTLSINEFNERIDGIKKAIPEFDSTKIDAKRMVLDELIRQQMLVQEARRAKLDRAKDIRDAVKDFENTLLVQELVSNLTKDVQATEQEARTYYDKNVELFVKPIEKQVREIVVPTETEAKDILVQILQGADFAQTATERSKVASAANGGDLGFIAEAPFDQFQNAAAGLGKGGVSAVFQGPAGYYIVKVEDIRGGDKASFDEVKEDLVKGLTIQKQQQAVLEKLADVAKKINVKVNVDLIEKIGE